MLPVTSLFYFSSIKTKTRTHARVRKFVLEGVELVPLSGLVRALACFSVCACFGLGVCLMLNDFLFQLVELPPPTHTHLHHLLQLGRKSI